MPITALRLRPVVRWTSSDESSLAEVLGALEYEVVPSDSGNAHVRHFQTLKELPHDLWSESNDILERLIPRLNCLFRFELTSAGAKVWRWTEVTGHPWFSPNDRTF